MRVLILSKGNSKENSVSEEGVYPIFQTMRVLLDGVIEDESAV